ncbi:MAG: hypothetical protein ABSC48_09100 [Terracidiphilus sp.]|jgi:hypothetical protein
MSLLHQETPEEIDDAARGEEFTKGSSHVVLAAVISAVLVSCAVAIYLWAGETPPVASGEIVQVWAHPGHVETSGFDDAGAPMPKMSFEEVLLFAHVKLRNESKIPLLLQDVQANTKLADGILSVAAGDAAQYEEVFVAYPELAALHAKALTPRTMIAPGENVDGNAFWVLRLSRQEWDARKELNFTVKFQYQPSLVLAPHTAVTEQ